MIINLFRYIYSRVVAFLKRCQKWRITKAKDFSKKSRMKRLGDDNIRRENLSTTMHLRILTAGQPRQSKGAKNLEKVI